MFPLHGTKDEGIITCSGRSEVNKLPIIIDVRRSHNRTVGEGTGLSRVKDSRTEAIDFIRTDIHEFMNSYVVAFGSLEVYGVVLNGTIRATATYALTVVAERIQGREGTLITFVELNGLFTFDIVSRYFRFQIYAVVEIDAISTHQDSIIVCTRGFTVECFIIPIYVISFSTSNCRTTYFTFVDVTIDAPSQIFIVGLLSEHFNR